MLILFLKIQIGISFYRKTLISPGSLAGPVTAGAHYETLEPVSKRVRPRDPRQQEEAAACSRLDTYSPHRVAWRALQRKRSSTGVGWAPRSRVGVRDHHPWLGPVPVPGLGLGLGPFVGAIPYYNFSGSMLSQFPLAYIFSIHISLKSKFDFNKSRLTRDSPVRSMSCSGIF